ncbi:methyltransferase [Kibdelosporangium aridum]|uniref:O-methyltransferase n=1 Tax=Kibdelosporangium aridum TaxID=2030 RepID=A0A1Y5XMH1_KIBAR|nr:methyltransferase [Kibdelosporangium aridum]SMC98013.1 O-methyltransferase [Kibdelosporangium aridum]
MTILGPGDIVGLVNSTYAADLFVTVVTEFDIFTRLAQREATTARQLSESLEIDERAADVTLTYLAALGLLERLPDGAVRPTEPAEQYLKAGSSIDLRHYVRTVSTRQGCRQASQVLRTGRPASWEGDGGDWLDRMSENDFADSFSAAMNARGTYLGPALAEVLRDLGRPAAPEIQPTGDDRQEAPAEDPHSPVVHTPPVVHSAHDTTPVDHPPSVGWQAGSPPGVVGDVMVGDGGSGAVRKILDIGGSSGIYACSLVQALPGTSAAVLDLPSVVDFTRESIAARGLADRVDVIAGDMFGDLPHGFDLHLYSNVWHDWDAGSISKLAAASFAALPPGGVLVDHDMHLDDTKSGPLRQAEFSVRMMLMTTGKCYSTPELAAILGPIGFEDIHLRPTTAGYSVVVARKPA